MPSLAKIGRKIAEDRIGDLQIPRLRRVHAVRAALFGFVQQALRRV